MSDVVPPCVPFVPTFPPVHTRVNILRCTTLVDMLSAHPSTSFSIPDQTNPHLVPIVVTSPLAGVSSVPVLGTKSGLAQPRRRGCSTCVALQQTLHFFHPACDCVSQHSLRINVTKLRYC